MVETLINIEKNIQAVLLREFRTNLVPDIEKRINDVRAKLNPWLPALKDLDARKSKASSVQYLEREIRVLVFRLQNVLETYSNMVQPGRGRSIIRKFIDNFKSFRMVDIEIKEINKQMKYFTQHLSILQHTNTTDEIYHSANENPETESRQKLMKSISGPPENHIVGMDHRIEHLISVLLDGIDGVICIYGSGGIGKTTLAHKLYTNQYVENHFYICSAVEIGQNFTVRDVLGNILKQLPEGQGRIEDSDLTLETLAEHFNKCVKDKGYRYLFVLDDIRSLDNWKFLQKIFPKVQNGSKLMLTTRLIDVALHVAVEDAGRVHSMWPLSESDSLELFQKTELLGDPDGKFLFHNIHPNQDYLPQLLCSTFLLDLDYLKWCETFTPIIELMLVDIYIMNK